MFHLFCTKRYFCAQVDTGREGTGHVLFRDQGNEDTGGIISARECHDQLFRALELHNAFLGKAHNDIKPDNLFVMEVTHDDSQPQKSRVFLIDWGDSGSTVGTLFHRVITSIDFTPLSVLLGQSKDFLPNGRDTHCTVIVTLYAVIGKPLADYMNFEVPRFFRKLMEKKWKEKGRAHMLPHLTANLDLLLRLTYILLVLTEEPLFSLLRDVEDQWPDLQLREKLKRCKKFMDHVKKFSLRVEDSTLAKEVRKHGLNPLALARGLHPDSSLAPTATESLAFMNESDGAKRNCDGQQQQEKRKRLKSTSRSRAKTLSGRDTTAEAPVPHTATEVPAPHTIRFNFQRPDNENKFSVMVTNHNLKLSELRQLCDGNFFRFHMDDINAMKDKSKILSVSIGDDWTQPYKALKGYTVSQIWCALPPKEKENPVTLKFFLTDVKPHASNMEVLVFSDDE